jgi:hypothetical protein
MKNKVKVFALLVALAAAAAGVYYRVPIVIGLVLAGLALFTVVSGVQMIVTRRATLPTSNSFAAHKEYYTGLPAQLWGVMFLMFGVVIGAIALSFWIYGDQPPTDLVRRIFDSRWASTLVIVGTGTTIGMFGLTRLLSRPATFVETKLSPVGRVAGGIYACALGGLTVAGGLVHLLAPGTLTRLRDQSIAWVVGLAK